MTSCQLLGKCGYAVALHRDDELVDRYDEVYFDMLGKVLERLIDDGRWHLIDVSVIDAKATERCRHDRLTHGFLGDLIAQRIAQRIGQQRWRRYLIQRA